MKVSNFKKLIKKIINIYYFFNVFSPLGFILALISIITIVTTIDEFLYIRDISLRGNSGIDITGVYTFVYEFKIIIIALLLFLVIYLLFSFILSIILREKFRKVLKKAQFSEVRDGKQYKIKITNKVNSLYLFWHAKINLINDISGSDSIDHQALPRAFLKNNVFDFDLSRLKTTSYSIDSIIFYLKDPLGLIDTKIYYDFDKRSSFIISNESCIVQSILKNKKTNIEGKYYLSRDPSEEFFSIREYQFGDQISRIHWKTTAKTRKLMTRVPERRLVGLGDSKIVINLYTPYLKNVDYSNVISNFLDSVISSIRSSLKDTKLKVDLYINGEEDVYIDDVNKYNLDKLPFILLKDCKCQDNKNLSDYIQEKNLDKTVIYTLSVDLSFLDSEESYIYRISKDDFLLLKSRIQKHLFSTKENIYGVSWNELLEIMNIVRKAKEAYYFEKFKNLVKSNETMLKGLKYISLNEVI